MKLQEIAERLRKEFPGRYTVIEFTACSHSTGRLELGLTLYIDALRTHLQGSTVEELIQAGKILLNKEKAKDVEVEL